ncbi:MAG: hypothetical protein O2816_10105 [Planctomycetota bacterium]|nr:hypothetical protein [Planctomycetota bacterium]
MATFENPNDPTQPCRGGYGWFARGVGAEFAVYVGNAGSRKSPWTRGTLARGVEELGRGQLSASGKNDRAETLDTNFIVGTTLHLLEKRGFARSWRHLSDHPGEERQLVLDHRPLLQRDGSTAIDRRCKHPEDRGTWKLRTLSLDRKVALIKQGETLLDKDLTEVLGAPR